MQKFYLQELRTLIDMTSSKEWISSHSSTSGRPIVIDKNLYGYASRIVGSYRRDENDIAYIAAVCPKNMQELIDRLEAQQAEITELKKANSDLASVAIEQPPYKADLQKRLEAAENALRYGIELIKAFKMERSTGMHFKNYETALAAWQKVKEGQ